MCLVLVLDDDADLLEMVDLTLSANGFAIKCISTGEYFFNNVDLVKPELILLDIFLGKFDGRKLCRQLKEHSLYQNIPVILYSAGNISHLTIEESKANLFISKPFDINHLMQKIKSLVKQNGKNA